MQVTIDITLVPIGKRWLAMTDVAGFELKSPPGTTPESALKQLLWILSGNAPDPTGGNAELGIALLVEGTDLQREIQRNRQPQALSAPDPTTGAEEWMREHPEATYQDFLDAQQDRA